MTKKRAALKAFNRRYEETITCGLSTGEKDRRFATLMTEMEQAFNIPMLKNQEWERENRAVIALYRKVSRSRTT
ncbi:MULTISPECIES: hypothetical protein [Halobacillus]|uniref:hypothetical protein n=1 Tax=Halobacillus TaxID=45667 RepID=UPI0009A89026|nr:MULTISPECIES: hypothetical protein [Halobacillus]